MILRYLGHSCFQWISEKGFTIVSDPYTKVGYELPNGVKADLVTLSHEHFDHNFTAGVQGEFEVLRGAVEKEFCGVRIQGITTSHDDQNGALRGNNVIYKIWMDGICFCHFGDLGEKSSPALLEKIGEVDVLLIPVGGRYTIDALQAQEYVEKIAPKIVIPMHFKPQDGELDIAKAEKFLNLFPVDVIKEVNGEVVLKSERLLEIKQKIIYMNRSEKL